MSNTADAEPRKQPSRRAVLRAGAHAAWAVPAIQIATATPVFAVSGQPSTPIPTAAVLGISGRFIGGNRGTTRGAFTVSNAAGHAGAIGLVVVITGAGLSYAVKPTNVSAGWTVTRTSKSFTFAYAGTLASGSSVPLSFSGVTAGTLDTSKLPWTWTYPVSITVSGTNVAPTTGAAKPASLSTTAR